MKRALLTLGTALAIVLCTPGASASEPVNTAGPLDCSTGICTQRLLRETVPAGTTQFHWSTLTQLFNRGAESAENVASYAQAWKQSASRTWSLVGETRCENPRGGCHGAEIDLVVNGPLQEGDWRLGQSIVIWALPGSTGTPTANHGLLIAPQWDRREDIRTNVGLKIDTRNNVAALQIRSGEKIALDDDGRVALRYNPVTRAVEILDGVQVVWSVPAP